MDPCGVGARSGWGLAARLLARPEMLLRVLHWGFGTFSGLEMGWWLQALPKCSNKSPSSWPHGELCRDDLIGLSYLHSLLSPALVLGGLFFSLVQAKPTSLQSCCRDAARDLQKWKCSESHWTRGSSSGHPACSVQSCLTPAVSEPGASGPLPIMSSTLCTNDLRLISKQRRVARWCRLHKMSPRSGASKWQRHGVHGVWLPLSWCLQAQKDF